MRYDSPEEDEDSFPGREMTKTIAVIGLGSIGMRHAKNLRDMGHHVWGMDPDMSRRLELGYDYTANRVEEIMSADAWVIASPTPEHARHLGDAIDYGVNVFIEKPIMDRMKLDTHEIKRLDTICKAMVGYNLRFHSCVKKAKEWLDADLIGKPLWANFTLGQYNDRPAYLRDGVILNWSHEIDLCLYLLGGADVVASSTRLTDGKDDMTDILLTHEDGCRSTIHLDYITQPEQRNFSITGESGFIRVNLEGGRIADIKCTKETSTHIFTDNWNDNYIEEMQAFIRRIDGEKTIGCTGEEGLKVLEMCLEVRKQAELE